MQAQEKEQTIVNGVNVTQLFETIGAIQESPQVAQFEFRADNEWQNGGLNRSTIQGFYGACAEDETRTEPFVMANDEPAVLLGTNQAANPVEYVLHALAGCLTTSIVYHAAAGGTELTHVASALEGDLDLHGFLGLDPEVRNGYKAIRVRFEIDGDATDEELELAVRTGQERSPVFEMISRSLPVEVTWNRGRAAA